MFKIKITGISEAGQLITEGQHTCIVSFLDKIHEGGKWVEPQDNHLITYADDCEQDLPQHGYIAPTKEQIDAILDFTKDLTDDDNVLVHCHAGVSRSTAMAIGICIQHGMTHVEAFEHIEKVRGCLYPNTLILKYIDDFFQLDGALIAHFKEWSNAKRNQLWMPENAEKNQKNTDEMQSILDILKKNN